ncbi:MAG: cytochrome P450 [Actinobacteria bacterium]|nr:cytochrome P450 [Actinomycetota bacterium]
MSNISIAEVSGRLSDGGHLAELRSDPIGLLSRLREECGAVGSFDLAGRRVVVVTGAEGNEWYFRASDEDLDQGEAYPFMTPIFGEGVVFDASPERRREMLHNQALRDRYMRGHAETIAREVEEMVAVWDRDGSGRIDLLDFFAELTIYTSSSCLIGRKFRDALDGRFARLYHDLERGTDALAFVDPYADIPSFRQRDASRAELVNLVAAIMDERLAGEPATEDDRDLLDVLLSIRTADGELQFDANIITGMFIAMMFAGHHTTSTTAAWTLLELLRHPEQMAAVLDEQDALARDGGDLTYQALRDMPLLESAIKEALRLHPPLILLLRVAKNDLEVLGHHIPAGDLVGATPAVSNRLAEAFSEPERYDLYRYLPPRSDDVEHPWDWIPFGAGRHRCVGAAFAMMQLKAIFALLLTRYRFELAQPADSYRTDHTKMVVQLAQPCEVDWVRR